MENYNHNYNHYYRKKAREENFYGGSRSKSQNNKRFYNGRNQQSALSLEKQFCVAVGGVSWEKVLDTQKYMYQEQKVIQWKDSAVQEAFWNAKNRFFAEMSGQPCDIQLPDPDSFIDKIDWDSSNIDHELMSDLDKRDLGTTSETEKDSGVVVGIPVIPEQFVLTPMGWGDAEDGQGQGEHSRRFDHTEKVNGWNDNDRVHYHEYKPNGGSRWKGGNKNKWWNNGGHNKRRNKWWNNDGWNDIRENFSGYRHYGNSYDNSYRNSYGSNNRGNFPSDIQWKPKPVSNRQW